MPAPHRPGTGAGRRRAAGTLLFLLLASGCATATPGDPGSLVGSRAPEFTALDVAGRVTRLGSFKDQKHVVLVFYIGHT